MSPTHRSCIFPGCHSVQGEGAVGLFNFPTDNNVRKRWIDFVKRSYCGEFKITTNTRLCSVHFTPDSYSNCHQVKSGYLNSPLTLVSGAELTLSIPGLHPPIPSIHVTTHMVGLIRRPHLKTLSSVTTISSADGQASGQTYQFCVTTNTSGNCPVVSFTMPAIILDCECWGLAPISVQVHPRDCWMKLRSGLWQASQVHLHQTGNNTPSSVWVFAQRLYHMQTLVAETHLKH